MNCPFCDSERIFVDKTINSPKLVKRYRHCETCKKYFWTTEIADNEIVQKLEIIK